MNTFDSAEKIRCLKRIIVLLLTRKVYSSRVNTTDKYDLPVLL